MDTVQDYSAAMSVTTETPKKVVTKRRFGKLSASEIAGLPGANLAVVKKVESDISYSIWFSIPVSGGVGTLSEAGQVHDFSYQLDFQAKAKGVGSVSAIDFTDGQAGVVLKLSATEHSTSHGIPITGAFAQLKEFLDLASVLHQSERVATWKAKVKGTTLVDGHF